MRKKELNPIFTPNFKLGYDAGKDHQKHNAEVRARKKYGAALTDKLTTVKDIEGVGAVMEKRIIDHFGGM